MKEEKKNEPRWVVYITLRPPASPRGGGRRVCQNTRCINEDCYTCPFEHCAWIGGELRTIATARALRFLKERRPNGFVIERMFTEEEAKRRCERYGNS